MNLNFRLLLLFAAAPAAMLSAQPAASPVAAQNAPPAPINSQDARETALSLADQLERDYVFPDVATRYGQALRAKAAAGDYDAIGSRQALADRLTADLRAISPDNHLRVLASAPDLLRPASAAAPGAAPKATIRPIDEARWLAPGIAYIRFTLFPPGEAEVNAEAAKFMADHADAKTVIIDVRTHRGGGLNQMNAIFPFLFSKPTPLVMMDTRTSVAKQGSPFEPGPTLRRIPTDEDVVRYEHFAIPGTSEKRLFDAKIFVLTSGFTASAAEHFSLAMKRTHRAILIGEATAGAGHYGGFRTVGKDFSVFIPVGRTFDPDTGKGWEAVGVAPDVEVPAERALVEALVRSGLAPSEAEKLSAEVHPQGSMKRRPRPQS
jgi:hypothetical protein